MHLLPLSLLSLLFLLLTAPTRTARVPPANLPHLPVHQSDPADRVPPEFNINSGGPAIGRFVAEKPSWIVGDTATSVQDNIVIGGAEEKNLPMYKSHRYGKGASSWGYDIPVMEPGVYDCTVHFAETHSDSFMDGKRVFDLFLVTTHGEAVKFDDIDIYKELNGAEFTVLTKTAQNLVIQGVLSIRVNPSAGNAIISGVTCERTADLPDGVKADWETDPKIPTEAVQDTNGNNTNSGGGGVAVVGTEININCGGGEVGRFTAEDYNWIRGTTSTFPGPDGVIIGGAEEKNREAVKSHRYGVSGSQWGYVIPVSTPGKYHCSLHFSETDTLSFKVGARVFKVMIQDRSIDDIDVYRDSGNAPFTSVVKTFLDLKIGNDLFIGLFPINGDAFMSAITCERAGDLDPDDLPVLSPAPSPEVTMEESPSPDATMPPEVTPSDTLEPATSEFPNPSPLPTPVVTVSSTFSAGPVPSSNPPNPSGSAIPLPSASISLAPSAVPIPDRPSPSLSARPSFTAAPSLIPTSMEMSASPVPSDEFDESPEPSISPEIPEAPLDPPLPVGGNQISVTYELTGRVTGDGVFTSDMKSTLLEMSSGASDVRSVWAMIGLSEDIEGSVSRQAGGDPGRSYDINLQAVYEKGDEKQGFEDYKSFIMDGDANTELQERSINNLDISFRTEPVLQVTDSSPASTSNTSVLVGALVGGVVALLAVIALVAFLVVRRNRGSDPDAAAFDAPPPPMSESEASSVMERSETAASVEYLDDDSTFTAATSRAGDHVDQVGYDKDVFGRGTSSGAHGSAV